MWFQHLEIIFLHACLIYQNFFNLLKKWLISIKNLLTFLNVKVDTDFDGKPDYLDDDDDNDGVLDGNDLDKNGDGILDKFQDKDAVSLYEKV